MLQSFVPDMWLSTGTVVRYSAFRKHCSAPSHVQYLGRVIFELARFEICSGTPLLTCKLAVGGRSRRTGPRTLPSEYCRRTRRSKCCSHSNILQRQFQSTMIIRLFNHSTRLITFPEGKARNHRRQQHGCQEHRLHPLSRLRFLTS